MSEPAIIAHVRTVPERDLDRPFVERRCRFAAIPRVGEHIVVEDEGQENSHALEVLAVLHHADPGSAAATIEVWARFVGSDLALLSSPSKDTRPEPAKAQRRRWRVSNEKRGWFELTYEGNDIGHGRMFSLRVGPEVGGDWGIELDALKTAATWTAGILGELTAEEIFRRVKQNRTDDKG